MGDFLYQLAKIGEVGVVEEVAYPIIKVRGLPHAKLSEIVIFETGERGQVFLLERELAQVLTFSKEDIKPGSRAARTDTYLSVPVGEELLGSIIDPLGNPVLLEEKYSRPKQERQLETVVPGISQRAKITDPFFTGVTVVDMMVPMGFGQKQLIVGARKVGKTSFLLMTIKNQVANGTIAIYASIGKRKADVRKIYEYFQSEQIADRTVIVAASSFDSPSLIYLTPFSAMTIAEYFRDCGLNVLIVFDDLSTHAQFYREVSLIARRFPGRDSYPGDIFYTHARLLERAGNFTYGQKQVSITALPVVEIIETDITGHITTNLIGITDGHLFFDGNVFYKGRRPAINISYSVTRVGRQVQSDLLKSIHRELTSFLVLYDRLQNLSHFGAELSESVKEVLKTGDAVYDFFDQPFPTIIPLEVQLVLFALIWLKVIDPTNPSELSEYRELLIHLYQDQSRQKLFKQLLTASTFNEFLSNVSRHKDEISIWKTSKN